MVTLVPVREEENEVLSPRSIAPLFFLLLFRLVHLVLFGWPQFLHVCYHVVQAATVGWNMKFILILVPFNVLCVYVYMQLAHIAADDKIIETFLHIKIVIKTKVWTEKRRNQQQQDSLRSWQSQKKKFEQLKNTIHLLIHIAHNIRFCTENSFSLSRSLSLWRILFQFWWSNGSLNILISFSWLWILTIYLQEGGRWLAATCDPWTWREAHIMNMRFEYEFT